jgi:glycosyltransferase involved in cell wall biosynthesis
VSSVSSLSNVDVALVSPYPSVTTPSPMPSGVAGYTERLAAALCDEGMRVHVLAPTADGEPALTNLGGVTVQRCYRRGAAALPMAALAARRCGAPVVHVQFETFLYGGPTSIPGVAPALAVLRRRRSRPVVTLHQVVDPATVDHAFTAVHRVNVPPAVARMALSAVQHAVPALASATVVHEQPFARVVPGAVVVPHGIDVVGTPSSERTRHAKEALGLRADRLSVLCFGFVAPYKGLETALQAAALTPEVELTVAGGSHPRLAQSDGYADDLRRRYGAVARFTGYVPDADVHALFEANDLLLLPYPTPFATSGPLALALGFGTPVLCSEALGKCVGAPPSMQTTLQPESLAERLRELAREPARREEVAAATRALTVGRRWDAVARRHIALYEEVTHAHRSLGRRVRPGKPGG